MATIDGTSGDDILSGTSGDDIIHGGAGNDQIVGGGANVVDNLYGDDGDDILFGGAGDDNISGGDGNDWIDGGGSYSWNLIYGNAGDDTLVVHFESHNDILDGGTGTDTALFHTDYQPYLVNFTVSGGSVRVSSSAGSVTLTDVEYAKFTNKTIALFGPYFITANWVGVAKNQTLSLLSDLVKQETDFSGPVTQWQLYDGNSNPDSGHFIVNGVVQPARTVITITAAEALNTKFVTGTVNDQLQIRAFDGTYWSAPDNELWQPFTLVVGGDHVPILTPTSVHATPGQVYALSSLFSVTDDEQDAITKYQLFDASPDPASGYLVVNGVVKPAETVVELTPAELAQAYFVAGTHFDSLLIRAYDGYEWSATLFPGIPPDITSTNRFWGSIDITPPSPPLNHAPVVTTSVTRVAANTNLPLLSLFSVSDADGDAITRYQFDDFKVLDPGGGYYLVNGVPEFFFGTFDVSAAEAAQINLVTGTGVDIVSVRVFDGTSWSSATLSSSPDFVAGPNANHAPVVTTNSLVTRARYQTLPLSSLFSVSDADGDAMAAYQFRDLTSDATSGHLVVNGQVQAAGSEIDVTAAQLSQAYFVPGTTDDELLIRAFDGFTWSAITGVDPWASVTIEVPNAPAINTNDFDADGKADVLWQNDSGQAAIWLMNGSALAAGGPVGGNPGPAWHIKGAGDFDGNGKADILWQNDSGQAAIWLMNGTNLAGSGLAGGNPGPTWHVKGAGDFDGDGKADILWQNDSGQAAIWLMNGTTLLGGGPVGGNPGPSWHIKATADFDGDGKSDILWQNDSGQSAIWLMNGTTLLGGGPVGGNPGSAWHVKSAGDFDGDGKADILWQNDAGQAAIWLMNGANLVAGGPVGANPGPDWHVMGATDINADARSDILWQNDSGQAAVWLMSSTSLLSGIFLGSNPGATWHIAAAGS